ncbi:ATP-dependent DNA helicase PIF1-like protein, partial [Tanacetum coccineum]
PGGRTAHSRFFIPLELLENSTCGIKQNTYLVELMQQVELIIWDEAPMTQKYAFEALDKTLRDILGYRAPEKQDKLFGGVTVLLGGYFRQILPVIPKGKRAYIVHACINRLELWKHCKVLAVGDGRVPSRMKDGEDEPTWIEIPEKLLINSSNSPIEQIVTKTCPNFIERQKDDAYLRERAILIPKNDDADAINAYMFKRQNPYRVTHGRYSQYTPDHLNIDTVQMALCLETATIPYQAMLAMTINKSQGQSLNYAGLFLPNPVFIHGQLYVTLSRVTDHDGLKILMKEDDNKELKNCTRNIIYKEAFNYLS